jgi:plasmid stabilization system protein ParE
VKVIVSPAAEAQIDTIDRWWREHRRAAPELFIQELAASLQLLALLPQAGHVQWHIRPDVRRICLRSSRYHVYYRVRGETLEVVALWSAVRGTGPDLTRLP